jgi:hypothetical protein
LTNELIERLERAKREVLADVAAGSVPVTVATFSQSHDYVDANGYGGAFDDDAPDTNDELWDALQSAIDGWIRSGDMARGKPRRAPMRHISENALEELAMSRLSRYRSERLQAHMAYCRLCQERFAVEWESRDVVKVAPDVGIAGHGRTTDAEMRVTTL